MWKINELPRTDDEVKEKFDDMYGAGVTSNSMFGIYRIYRERDNLVVLDAYRKALEEYIAIYDKDEK